MDKKKIAVCCGVAAVVSSATIMTAKKCSGEAKKDEGKGYRRIRRGGKYFTEVPCRSR